VVGAPKEKATGGGSVEPFPEPARQLPVIQLGWRQWRVAVASKDFTPRTPGTILDGINELRNVGSHEGFLAHYGKLGHVNLVVGPGAD
jgi:hypothetical protein